MFKFITSALEPGTWPATKEPQVIFWGRSNVGKSSLLNALTDQKLAFVSKTPGRTQLINFFSDNNGKFLVDLPGYGYAQMSKSQQDKMLWAIKQYLSFNAGTKHLFILLDSRTGITKIDLETIHFIQQLGLKYSLIYTKLDKLNQKEKSALIKKHSQHIEANLISDNVNVFLVSAQKRINLDELTQHISDILYPNAE
ncbi:ribosome biogenesis GTP-binding protein YihA/YsxC [Mycoplasma simbae]|uniref:ribosome biogenesis GTP-binding protein YihA/YsxC n=1 Tax=Mycoplasma simbae TaxID=36744 RepID=UPI000497E927|nr:ribosome biogenesis GTP-binding protein YihA/YsxC [Mycoplasma simbae]